MPHSVGNLHLEIIVGSHMQCVLEAEIIRPIIESTTTLLKFYEKQVLKIELERLLDEVKFSCSIERVSIFDKHRLDNQQSHCRSYIISQSSDIIITTQRSSFTTYSLVLFSKSY